MTWEKLRFFFIKNCVHLYNYCTGNEHLNLKNEKKNDENTWNGENVYKKLHKNNWDIWNYACTHTHSMHLQAIKDTLSYSLWQHIGILYNVQCRQSKPLRFNISKEKKILPTKWKWWWKENSYSNWTCSSENAKHTKAPEIDTMKEYILSHAQFHLAE